MTHPAPNRAPGNRSHLERLVQALSVEEGIAADRLRRWVSTMVLLGTLERLGDTSTASCSKAASRSSCG